MVLGHTVVAFGEAVHRSVSGQNGSRDTSPIGRYRFVIHQFDIIW